MNAPIEKPTDEEIMTIKNWLASPPSMSSGVWHEIAKVLDEYLLLQHENDQLLSALKTFLEIWHDNDHNWIVVDCPGMQWIISPDNDKYALAQFMLERFEDVKEE